MAPFLNIEVSFLEGTKLEVAAPLSPLIWRALMTTCLFSSFLTNLNTKCSRKSFFYFDANKAQRTFANLTTTFLISTIEIHVLWELSKDIFFLTKTCMVIQNHLFHSMIKQDCWIYHSLPLPWNLHYPGSHRKIPCSQPDSEPFPQVLHIPGQFLQLWLSELQTFPLHVFMGGVSQEFVQRDDIPGDLNTSIGEWKQGAISTGSPSTSSSSLPL